MNQPTAKVTVERLATHTAQDAAMIGALLPHLSDKFLGDPVPQPRLSDIVESPFHDVLVARDGHGLIVGMCVMSIKMNITNGRNGQLEDFVVDTSQQSSGIGSKLWDEAVSWCKDRGAVRMNFTSNSARKAAHQFYLKRGARIRDTSYFTKEIE